MQQTLISEKCKSVSAEIERYSKEVKKGLHQDARATTVSELFNRFNNFIDKRTNFSSPGDTGCAMFIRAGILNKSGPHSDSKYHAGATSMFNKGDLLLAGNIKDIGGVDNLVVGMILGSKIRGTFNDGKYHVEHVGVYAGTVDSGNGPIHLVYSFNTNTNRGNLSPFSSNEWLYYGWHKGITQ